MGKVAGGVAHDFNNLIGVILNYATVIAEEVADRPHVRQDVEEIRLAAQRAADLTRELLLFSRRLPARLDVVDVTGVFRDMRRTLERALGPGIDLVIRCASGPCLVRADRGHLERVLMNLAVNARDAMPGGGKLTVTTTADLDESDPDLAQAALAPGRYVRIAVVDTGVGMSEETAARAFEPFFTTKAQGQGTGLGLATVYALVAEAGGTVTLRSTPGRGTTVAVLLPAARRAERTGADEKEMTSDARS
jgi:signal transduction histidine kinase